MHHAQLEMLQNKEEGSKAVPNASFLSDLRTILKFLYQFVKFSPVPNFDNYYDNEIYNLFAHEEHHSELPESTQVELDRCVVVNHEAKAANERFIIELEQYKGHQTFFENNEQTYNELETGYRNFVYAEKRLTLELDDLTRGSKQMIRSLNAEISDLKTQLLKQETAYSTLEKERD
ncbi:hypothetical protein Tco_1307978 [Tanacetum coccineum]